VVLHETISALALYVREVGQIALLSREEEVTLARRAQAGDAAAREELIKANLRLALKIAHDYDGLGLPLLDLISEGNIGLMKCVDRYDPAKGAKLSVYASIWIKQYIRGALSHQARTIRVPVDAQNKLHAVGSVILRLQELLGRDPTCDEIAREAGLLTAWVQRTREAMQPTISLDAVTGDPERRSLAETIADEHCIAPDEALAQATLVQRLRHFIARLSEREQIILRSRFGLDGEKQGTFASIGRRLGIVHERVRQIHNSTMTKLRKRLNQRDLLFPALEATSPVSRLPLIRR